MRDWGEPHGYFDDNEKRLSGLQILGLLGFAITVLWGTGYLVLMAVGIL